nr:hypothetical protein CFP56_04553 [Quercus suber]
MGMTALTIAAPSLSVSRFGQFIEYWRTSERNREEHHHLVILEDDDRYHIERYCTDHIYYCGYVLLGNYHTEISEALSREGIDHPTDFGT